MVSTISNDVFDKIKKAVKRGDWDAVKQIYSESNLEYNSSSSNDTGYMQQTVLHVAAEKRQLDITRQLVEMSNVDVNVADKYGYTALYIAARYGHVETVSCLLAAPGIQVNVANKYGYTALYVAASEGHVEAVSCLLAAPGIQVNVANKYGYTALCVAAESGHVETVSCLLAAPGIQVNVAEKSGQTALHVAARRGHVETVNCLLAAPGILVNVANSNGYTALHVAASKGHVEAVSRLLAAPGIQVNVKDYFGYTALYVAARDGHVEIVSCLLAAPGIQVNVANSNGYTALYVAAEKGHVEIMSSLFAAPGIQVNVALHRAAEKGHVAVMKRLNTARDLDYSVRTKRGDTAIAVLLQHLHNTVSREDISEIITNVPVKNLSDPAAIFEDVDLLDRKYGTEVGSILLNLVVKALPTIASDPERNFVLFKTSLYPKLIKLFLDEKRDIDREGVLKLIYIALQANVSCDQSKTEMVMNKLEEEEEGLFNRFSVEIKKWASWRNKTDRKDIHLIALKIHTNFLKIKTGCVTDMTSCAKSLAKYSWKKVKACLTSTCKSSKSDTKSDTESDTKSGDEAGKHGTKKCHCGWFPHNCKIRGLFPLVFCIMGIVTYVLDLSSDLVVGFDDYERFSKTLGIFEIFLVLFTLIHENIRSSLSLYETEKELLRIKVGRTVLYTKDWEESQLNYHKVSILRWLYMVLWPFRVRHRGVLQGLKAILFNILSFIMVRPLVDRLIVLFHEPTTLRSYYRHQVEQNSLKQFYLILEQIPELLVQFYTFQIVINNIVPAAETLISCNQVFNYDIVLNNTNNTNFICNRLSLSPENLIRCSTWFRIFSMSLPFINIPSGIVSLEAGFRILDPFTPTMSSKVKYTLQATYTLMIPARVFLVAVIMHALPEKFYAIYYIIFRVVVELLINLWLYHKATVTIKEEHTKELSDGIRLSRIFGKFWRLTCFAVRDVFAISLRDPKAYMDKPSEVSYKSLRNWNSLALRAFPFILEGFFGAWYIEYYYPCGNESYTFKYLGWLCLLLLTFSLTLLVLLSDLLHPPRTKCLPTIFLKKSLTTSSFGFATCGIAAMAFFFSNTKIPAEQWVVTVVMVIYLLFFGGVVTMLFYDTKGQTKKYEHSVLFSEDKTKNNKSCPLFCCPRAEGIPGKVDDHVKENSNNSCIIICCPRAREQKNKIDEMDKCEGAAEEFTGKVEGNRPEEELITPADEQNEGRDVSNVHEREASETCCIPLCCSRLSDYKMVSSTGKNSQMAVQSSRRQAFLKSINCLQSTIENDDIELSDLKGDSAASPAEVPII